MKRFLPIALTVVLLSGSPPCPGQPHIPQSNVGVIVEPGNVRDHAKLFSAGAVEKADESLLAVARETRWRVVIETVESLDGKGAAERAVANAKALDLHGLYVLIAKKEHKIAVEPSHSAEPTFPKAKDAELRDTLVADFKAKHFDQGLLDLVAKIRTFATERPRPGASPVVPGVRDHAKLFSSDAVAKADRMLETIRKNSPWQVVIETVESLGGQTIQQRTLANAKALDIHGLYLLIAKQEQKFDFEPSDSARSVFNTEHIGRVEEDPDRRLQGKALRSRSA